MPGLCNDGMETKVKVNSNTIIQIHAKHFMLSLFALLSVVSLFSLSPSFFT